MVFLVAQGAAACVHSGDTTSDSHIAYLSCIVAEQSDEIRNLERLVQMQGEAIIANGERLSALRDQMETIRPLVSDIEDDIEALKAAPNPFPAR